MDCFVTSRRSTLKTEESLLERTGNYRALYNAELKISSFLQMRESSRLWSLRNGFICPAGFPREFMPGRTGDNEKLLVDTSSRIMTGSIEILI